MSLDGPRSQEKGRMEALRRSVLEQLPLGIALHELVYDDEGQAVDYRILEVNRAFEIHTGIPAEQACGRLVSELSGQTPPPFLDEYVDVAHGGGSCDIESYVEFLGRHFHILASSSERGCFATIFEDVTERLRTDEVLQQAHQRLLDIIEFLPDATFVLGRDRRVVAWNRALEAMTGVKKEDMLGQGDHAYAVPFYGERRPILVDLIFDADESVAERYDFVRRHGDILEAEVYVPGLYQGRGAHVWVCASVLRDETGAISSAIESVRDITERKRTADALQQAHQHLVNIIELLPDATFVLDRERRVVAWNRALEVMTGVRKHDILGQGDHVYGVPFYGEPRPILVDLAFEMDEAISGRYDYVQRHGDTLEAEVYVPSLYRGRGAHVWVYASVLRDEDGRITGGIESVRDITVRKQALVAMEKSEKRLGRILDAIGTGVFAVDPATLIITYANPATAALIGVGREELLGQSCKRYLCTREGNECPFADGGETAELVEQEILAADGRRIPVLKTISRTDLDGRERILESIIDLSRLKEAETEKKRLEEELALSRKMEAIGQLAGGVAHDFNNLLTGILGYTEMVMDDTDPDDERHALLQEVFNAGERARRLVGQLLAFSRRQVMQPEVMDLSVVIEELLKMLGRLIGENIELDFVPGDQAVMVQADRGMVEQVLMNLCVNARDAMPEGGNLHIETREVSLAGEFARTHPWARPGRFMLMVVSDTGCGMDAHTQEHIFEPFFTTKPKGSGTGLGMATVYGIVKQHDGMIHVYSEPGRGTTIRVYLPVVDEEAAPARERSAVRAAGGAETILLAEDDDTVRSLARRILTGAGYSVLEAADGETAVALFEEHADEVGMLVLDVVMPRLGGRGVYERVRKLKPGIRALFASGYSESAIHTRFVLDEGLHFVQKPYDRQALLRHVREVLDAE